MNIKDGKGKTIGRFQYLEGEEPIENRDDIHEKVKKCISLGHKRTEEILNFSRTYRKIECTECCYSFYEDSSG
ncbi:MAG: hypothetical protein JWM20_365 [Patescibacteria group bacterium]|nr:hypothetical protein [Patescibacteria group bacterium]